MKIYANGCSFTYGDELADNKSAWPHLVAKKMGAELVNDAISGGTNQRTVYHTIKNLKDFDMYLIAWTIDSRYTFYKSDNNFEINFNPQLKNDIYGSEEFFNKWGMTLYRTWHNQLFAFKLWLQQIIQLQSLLKDKNYLMVNTMSNMIPRWTAPREKFIESVKDMINFDLMTDEQIFDEYDEIQYYMSLIDVSKFYQWGDFHIAKLTSIFPCGSGGHILEEGHQHFANLIYDKLCSK